MALPRESHPLAADPPMAVLVECLAAAVCHATNWDRLRGHLMNAAKGGAKRFTPSRLAALTRNEFVNEFGEAFADTVRDLPRRHGMFTSVAAAFAEDGGVLDGLRLRSGPHRLGGPLGIYSALDRLGPFHSDPRRKKSRVFVQQLLRFGIIAPTDPDELLPAIEYHLIRLYLRTGRVTHEDERWLGAHAGRASDLDSVTTLRVAVEDAMRCTAKAAGLTLGDINEIEWQIGRSYCDRETPRCSGPARPDKPVAHVIEQARTGECPFAAVCQAPHDPGLAQLTEPQLASHHAFY